MCPRCLERYLVDLLGFEQVYLQAFSWPEMKDPELVKLGMI